MIGTLIAVTAVFTAGFLVWEFGPALGLGWGKRKALPASSDSKALPRGMTDLRKGDVLSYQNEDHVVSGVISYEEDGHRWSMAFLDTGVGEKWFLVGVERMGLRKIRLLELTETEINQYPPEQLVIGETKYVVKKNGAAIARFEGDLPHSPIGSDKYKTAERCRWWLYESPGAPTCWVEQWGEDFRVLVGEEISESMLDFIHGS